MRMSKGERVAWAALACVVLLVVFWFWGPW